jgi:hypothetical protein
MKGNLRLDEAREQARLLEDAIARARETYRDVPAEDLAAYLRGPIEELYAIRARIDDEIGVEEAQLGLGRLWLRLRGGAVGEGRAPAQAVGRVLGAVQSGVKQLGVFLETGVAMAGKLPDEIASYALLDVVGWRPGSARIALSPVRTQLTLSGPPLAEAAAEIFVRAAIWAEAEESDIALDSILPDPALRRQVLSRIREIAPSVEGEYDTVEFSGPWVRSFPDAPAITPRAHRHVSSYLKRRQREPVRLRGKLVAVDVERDVFDLRFEDRRIHCRFGDDLKPAAKALVEMYVEVAGEGVFQLENDVPTSINAESLRRLSREEQVRLK